MLQGKDVYKSPDLFNKVISDKVLGKLDPKTAIVKPKTEAVPFKLTKLFGLTQACAPTVARQVAKKLTISTE
jgi:hypothetical protein